MRVVSADLALGARIEAALAPASSGSVIVTADLGGLSALRLANPGARVIVVGLRRAQVARALDAGADCALAGELRPAELRARVRALASRDENRRSVGALALDRAAHVVTLGGAALELTRREFALLWCLAAAPGHVLTKQELARGCRESVRPSSSRALERQVARLRRRLGVHASVLVTVWGVGYRLDPPV